MTLDQLDIREIENRCMFNVCEIQEDIHLAQGLKREFEIERVIY